MVRLPPGSQCRKCVVVGMVQGQVKKVFLEIINMLKNGLVHLNLTIVQNYSKVLYKDVYTEYIDDLNNEISQTYEEMKKQNLIVSGN